MAMLPPDTGPRLLTITCRLCGASWWARTPAGAVLAQAAARSHEEANPFHFPITQAVRDTYDPEADEIRVMCTETRVRRERPEWGEGHPN